jgi:hypothetical protein
MQQQGAGLTFGPLLCIARVARYGWRAHPFGNIAIG